MLPQYHPSAEAQLWSRTALSPLTHWPSHPSPIHFCLFFFWSRCYWIFMCDVFMAHIWGCVWIVVLFTYVWILVSLDTYRSMSLINNNDIASKVNVKVIFDRIQTSKNWTFASKNILVVIHMPLWLLMEHKYKYTCNTPARLTQQKTPDTMVTYLTLLSSLNVMFVL